MKFWLDYFIIIKIIDTKKVLKLKIYDNLLEKKIEMDMYGNQIQPG